MKKNSCARVGQKKIMQAKSVGRSEFLINFSVVPMSLRCRAEGAQAGANLGQGLYIYTYFFGWVHGPRQQDNGARARLSIFNASLCFSD